MPPVRGSVLALPPGARRVALCPLEGRDGLLWHEPLLLPSLCQDCRLSTLSRLVHLLFLLCRVQRERRISAGRRLQYDHHATQQHGLFISRAWSRTRTRKLISKNNHGLLGRPNSRNTFGTFGTFAADCWPPKEL